MATSAEAAGDGRQKAAPTKRPKRLNAELRMSEIEARRFAGAVRLSWRTSYEANILGYKVWREDAGQRTPVREEPVAGSLLTVSTGLLSGGGEYALNDSASSESAVYWIEAIDVNAESRWYGPVAPIAAADKTLTAAEESTLVSELNGTTEGFRREVETVEPPAAPVGQSISFNQSRRQAARAPLSERAQFAEEVSAARLSGDPNAFKIEVRNRGLYRVDASALAEQGFDQSSGSNWKLYAGGVEQPLIVNQDGSLEFFGNPIETLQTDANVYWLVPDVTGGQRINRVAQGYLPAAVDGFYMVTAERSDKLNRVSSVLNGARENWFGAVVNAPGVNQTVTLNDIAAGSGATATVRVNLQGLTSSAHQVAVTLNGTPIGQINFNYLDRSEWTINVPLAYLLEGTNTLNLRAVGAGNDVSIIEKVGITYPRRLKARNDRLEFGLAANQAVKLRGFTVPTVRLFDITNPSAVVEYAPESRQEADGTYTVTVAASSAARVMLAESDSNQPSAAMPLVRNTPSDLRNTQNQARFIIISPREFIKAFWELRDLRRWQGISTEIVAVEDIYDEFNNGIRSAESIRSFLQYAKTNWTVKPDYVLFGGNGSLDPKNYSGRGGNLYNRVPTIFIDTWNIETVSDEMMVDFDGDDVGEISHGRMPASTAEEINAMVQRAVAFKSLSRTDVSRRGVHFVSDALIGYDFAAGSRNASGTIPANVSVNFMDRTGQNDAAMRADLIDRINAGAAIVNYFGHAALGAWAGGQLFRNTDAPSLVNQKRQPLMVMLACLNGNYAEPNIEALARAIMKQPHGGAMAIWAASGWNTAQAQEYMAREFYQRIFAGMPMGDAAREAKATSLMTDQRRTYIFFGDPTLVFVRP